MSAEGEEKRKPAKSKDLYQFTEIRQIKTRRLVYRQEKNDDVDSKKDEVIDTNNELAGDKI